MKPSVAALACAVAAGSAPASGAGYAIDYTHTFVNFEVLHLGLTTSRGRFNKSEGTLEFDRAAHQGQVDITVDTASVDTGLPALDGQLRGEKFLDSARHPTARFVSERFVFNGDRLTEVAGALTLLGRTLPVTLRATRFNCYTHPFLRREVCGGDFEAAIQRTQWGMKALAPDLVGDPVRLVLQIEAIRQ
jgi:polyisoprenoid-binding protein YceI